MVRTRGTDGDAAAEPNPRGEIMGAAPAWHGARELGGGGIGFAGLLIPAGKVVFSTCSRSRCQEFASPRGAG